LRCGRCAWQRWGCMLGDSAGRLMLSTVPAGAAPAAGGRGGTFLRVNASLLISAAWTIRSASPSGLTPACRIVQPLAQVLASVRLRRSSHPADRTSEDRRRPRHRLIALMLLGTQLVHPFQRDCGRMSIPSDCAKSPNSFTSRAGNDGQAYSSRHLSISHHRMVTASGGRGMRSGDAEYSHVKTDAGDDRAGRADRSATDSGKWPCCCWRHHDFSDGGDDDRLVWRRLYRLARRV